MANERNGRLKLLVEGKRRSITVPSARAAALHAYLRSHSVIASPPVPSFTGFDTIEIAEGRETTAIDGLLKSWHLAASTPAASK
jgi:hypothetical protein